MTPDVLLDTEDVVQAVAAALELSVTTFTAHPSTLPVKTVPPYFLVTARAPHPEGPPMAGDQTLELTIAVITAGVNDENAARGAAASRSVLVGRDAHGAFLTPLSLDGRTVLTRSCNYDGAPDRVAGVAQWSETYQLVIGRGTA